MIRLLLRLSLFLLLILTASACGVLEAVEVFFVGSAEAAQATTDAAHQAEDTLHTLQHVLMLFPPYILGEVRKPLWGKLKSINGRRKKKAAA